MCDAFAKPCPRRVLLVKMYRIMVAADSSKGFYVVRTDRFASAGPHGHFERWHCCSFEYISNCTSTVYALLSDWVLKYVVFIIFYRLAGSSLGGNESWLRYWIKYVICLKNQWLRH